MSLYTFRYKGFFAHTTASTNKVEVQNPVTFAITNHATLVGAKRFITKQVRGGK